MPALDFPASPTIGDTFTGGSRTWQWDGVSWNLVINQFSALTVTGDITFPNVSNVGLKNAAATSYFHLDRASGNGQWLTKAGAQAYIDADTFNVRSNGGTSRLVLGSTGLSTPLQITSTLATGTAPLAVTSTTENTNLNANFLQGSIRPDYAGTDITTQASGVSAQTQFTSISLPAKTKAGKWFIFVKHTATKTVATDQFDFGFSIDTGASYFDIFRWYGATGQTTMHLDYHGQFDPAVNTSYTLRMYVVRASGTGTITTGMNDARFHNIYAIFVSS